MENLIFCINAVLPVFFMIFIGLIMIRRKIIDDKFASTLNHLVYQWLLPAMLFTNIYESDIESLFDGKLVAYFAVSTIVVYILAWTGATLFIKDSSIIGSFVQICYRGNYILMGIAVITGVFGKSGVAKASVMAPILVALYSILAVTVFTIMAENNNSISKFKKIASTLISIITNPLVISIIIALPFSLFKITLPPIIYKPIEYVSSMSTPVALIGIGAALNFDKLRNTMKISLLAAFVKTVVNPLILIPIAIYLGFRGVELGILAVIFSAPVAVGSYSMAKALGGDADLAANGVLLSTIMSVGSILITFYVLKTLALI